MGYGRLKPLALAALIIFTNIATASPPVEVINVDLGRLIDRSILHPNRFAVDVPYRITSDANGTWKRSGSNATWSLAIRIPTAVSMSFHADAIQLPPSARMLVTAGGVAYVYTAKDIDRGHLWSRIAKGDQLHLEISVPLSDRAQVRLRITSLQAGYRSLERGGTNHPRYNALRTQLRAATVTSCVENYECNADSANHGPAQATVAILIANIGQCSGTLLNDAPADGIAYVLTARHCENDTPGGGAPQNAASVTIYWDATTACGQVLGTIYDPGIPEQAGASTVVEQQDAWLIRLDASPIVAGAYYAGWDATGSPITGGYTIHHEFSNSKQYTAWYGQSVLATVPGKQLDNLPYASTFWSVVNQLGSIGPGASGSGLFDSNAQLIGSLSLGLNQNGAGSTGVCPANPLVAPNGNNGAADFTALSSVFASTSDTTSTTGSTTIQAVLDPQHTGTLTVNGLIGLAPISLTADSSTPAAGTTTKLRWSAPSAGACTASGGVAGDGWGGTLPPSGAATISEATQSIVTYSIACTVSARQLTAQVAVSWGNPTPSVDLIANPSSEWINGIITIGWGGDVSPCTLSGAVSAGNLPAFGTTTITEAVAGNYQVAISCGSGSNAVQSQQSVTFTKPQISFNGYAERLVNEGFLLEFQSYANRCVPSGGGTDPSWTSAVFAGNGAVWIYEPVAGTYTYSLTCYAATESAQASTTVAIQSGPASVTLTANSLNVPYGNPITLDWITNVDNCIASEPTPNPGDQWSGGVADGGPQIIQEPVVGTNTYVINCGTPYTGFGTAQSQVTVAVTPSTTAASLSASAAQVEPGQAFTLTWDSTNAFICIGAGAVTDTQWNTQNGPTGSLTISESSAGTYTYSITCSAGTQSAAAQKIVTVGAASTGGSAGSGSSTGGSTGSGGGGGGALDIWSLFVLTAMAVSRSRPRRMAKRAAHHDDQVTRR
jgi:hypothetical protein